MKSASFDTIVISSTGPQTPRPVHTHLNPMPAVVRKTGPGGTELLERPKPIQRKQAAKHAAAITPQREHQAWDLRQAVELAKQALAGENAQNETLSHNLETARSHRRQFWMDTCREAPERRSASRQLLDLYGKHGCRFRAPTHHQVQHILDALDSAMPHWDRDHPDLFYQTLELNFPELARSYRTRYRG